MFRICLTLVQALNSFRRGDPPKLICPILGAIFGVLYQTTMLCAHSVTWVHFRFPSHWNATTGSPCKSCGPTCLNKACPNPSLCYLLSDERSSVSSTIFDNQSPLLPHLSRDVWGGVGERGEGWGRLSNMVGIAPCVASSVFTLFRFPTSSGFPATVTELWPNIRRRNKMIPGMFFSLHHTDPPSLVVTMATNFFMLFCWRTLFTGVIWEP